MNIPARIILLLAMLLAVAPAAKIHAQDAPAGASFDLFYNNLADDGEWYNTPDYGYVWQPNIAYQNNTWRPYTDGYWAETDLGWTWVSYESFGWATYHYGRWTRLNDLGWAWVPGYDWGPGWVSWRTSNDYVGWAPLPPQPVNGVTLDYSVVENETEGYTPAVDAQFDIGPQNFCFVQVANFGAPVLSQVLLPPQQNITIIVNTVNVTNVYYNNVGGQVVVYNRGGPDYNFISTRVSTPIQRLQIQSNTDPNYLRGNHPPGFNPTQVHSGVLQVAAPVIAHTPVNFQQIKPPRVKATLAKAEVIHGWSGANGNPQAVEQAREKIKQQAQAVPKRQPNGNIPMPGANAAKGPAPEPRERPATPAPANPAVKPAPRLPANEPAQPPRPEQQRTPEPKAPAPREEPRTPAPREPAPREEQHTPAPKEPAAREEQRTPAPKEQAPREEQRTPAAREPAAREEKHTPAPKEQAAREEQRTPAPKEQAPREEQRTPVPREPAAREEQRTPAPKEPAAREEHTPEPKAPAAHEERTPAPRAAGTPREQDHAAKPEPTRRDESANKSDDEKKKKKETPQP
jgi:hypothetical protein